MRPKISFGALIVLLCMGVSAYSQSILVCDKDHDKTFQDPEGAGAVDATYGVVKALDANGYVYTRVNGIPADLSPYDIVFLVMGVYC